MLKSVESGDKGFLKFCNRDVFGTRISAYYNCYGTNYDFVKFWAQYDDSGAITAAVGRVDGETTICAENADVCELNQFMNIVGFRTILCEKSLAEKLAYDNIDVGYVMLCKNTDKYCPLKVKKHFELREIYDIIKEVSPNETGEYLPWLSDVTYRINRNAAEGIVALDGEKNAGCAMVLFRTDSAAVLGAVATRPQYRGRGIARSLVLGLAREEMKNGRRVELLCKNGSIVEFYKSIGFDVTNEWGLIKNAAEFL